MLEVGPTESRMIPVLVWLCKSTAGLVREARRSKAPCDFPHPTPAGVLRNRARAERFPCGVTAATSTSDQLARSTRPLRPNRADLHIHGAGLRAETRPARRAETRASRPKCSPLPLQHHSTTPATTPQRPCLQSCLRTQSPTTRSGSRSTAAAPSPMSTRVGRMRAASARSRS